MEKKSQKIESIISIELLGVFHGKFNVIQAK
jgi:hypothetical protein